jgi:hypothetical protein
MRKIFLPFLLLCVLATAAFQYVPTGYNKGSAASNLRVQGATQRTSGAANTNALAFGSNVVSGHVLLAFGLSVQTQTIADSQSNTWHQGCPTSSGTCTGSSVTDTNGCVHDISGGGIGYACMWYTTAGSSAADTVTITTAANNVSDLWIVEIKSPTEAFDLAVVSNGNSGFNSSCTSGASGSVAGSGEVFIGQGVDNGNYTYTPTGSLTTNDAATKLADQQVMYNLSSSSGAQTASATLSGSGNWICEGMAFK